MRKFVLNETFIYRNRFVLGYGLFSLGLLAVLLFAGLYSPGGISNDEIKSVIDSSNISLSSVDSLAITSLPYHLLQKASLAIFGTSVLSIKLPSIILAFFSAIGIVLLLRRWFKPSVGVLASMIAISTGQFIFFAQDGTPSIMYIFWIVWLLLLASSIIRNEKYRIVYTTAFYVTAALSLYTPFSIYVLIALVGSILLHPHLRYFIRKMPKTKIAMGVIIAIMLISPLIIFISNHPRLGLDLLGIPAKWPNLLENLKTLGTQYFVFTKPGGSALMTPFFELGSMLIVGIGAIQVLKQRHTSKNYLIIIWTIFIIPIIIINPKFTSVTYLPIVLLLVSGLNKILSEWYSLFPRNPYARIGGLIPLSLLVFVLVFSGTDRYVYGYNYDPKIVNNFSRDITFATSGTKNLLVSNSELPFYQVVAKYNPTTSVSTLPSSDMFWATKQAKGQFEGYEVDRIITSYASNNSDRFYLYKKTVE